nr:MAG TPA: apocytochrome F [Caudoviricetes sp.]
MLGYLKRLYLGIVCGKCHKTQKSLLEVVQSYDYYKSKQNPLK